MWEKRYLLSVSELLREEEMLKESLEKLDEERRKKAMFIKVKEKQAQSIGAGLLLQKLVQDYENEHVCKEEQGIELEEWKVSALLEDLSFKRELQYTLGKNGKPYLADVPIFFSLSHSAEYVFCAASSNEIGADIQIRRSIHTQSLVKKYFSRREKQWLEQMSGREKERAFYALWTRKEAYGKLTGEGVAKVLKTDTLTLAAEIYWEEWQQPEGYNIAVCRRR